MLHFGQGLAKEPQGLGDAIGLGFEGLGRHTPDQWKRIDRLDGGGNTAEADREENRLGELHDPES